MRIHVHWVFRGAIFSKDIFYVKIIHTQKHVFELSLRLIIWWKTVVINIESIQFFLNGMFCLMEKCSKTADYLAHLFGLANLFTEWYSILFCSPSKVVTISYEFGILIIKFIHFVLYFVEFVLNFFLCFQIEVLFIFIKCCLLKRKT